MHLLRLLPCALLLAPVACNDDGVGDDLPPGAFTSGPDDDDGTLPPDTTTDGPGQTESTSDGTQGSESTGLVELSHDEDIQPIWTASCIDSTCHDSDGPAGTLDLQTAGVRDRLCSGFHSGSGTVYVDCEGLDPQESFLFRKIEWTHGDFNGAGSPMPPAGMLDPATLATVETWILGGAMP